VELKWMIMTDKEKPTTAWYLAPIFLVVIGSAIMWYVLKDNEHEITKSMIHKVGLLVLF